MKKLTSLSRFFAGFFALLLFVVLIGLPNGAFARTPLNEGQTPWAGRDREQIREWRQRSNSINNKINNLDSNPVSNIPVPILFGVTPDHITSDFGDPRSGGRSHEGQDILAPRGAPVVTPTTAVVIRVGTGDSSGNYVYTANPGGETFAYMHLDQMSALSEGALIEKGTLIGYVGNTGNAAGGPTHLHFEIRHDGGAVAPLPRLQSIFPLSEKITYLTNILGNRNERQQFAEQMVTLYRKEFILANTLGLILPAEIQTALLTVPFVAAKTSTNPANGDLKLGSRGQAVVTLQRFLISKNVGSAAKVIADGSFGPITQKALAEYQASVGIKPAAGYYGPITRAYVLSHP